MKKVFRATTNLSVKYRIITLIAVIVITALGVSAWTQLKQELLPPVSFPQTIILAQVSGMTSDQVLNIITKRIEEEISKIPEILNVQSTTTSSIGAVITASNNFGLEQEDIQNKIKEALRKVWIPNRSISPNENESKTDFSKRLIGDLTPDVLIYIAERNNNFLFQLDSQIWDWMNEDTLKAIIQYMAVTSNKSGQTQTALEQLVRQEIEPQISALSNVADISISGGQQLPSESGPITTTQTERNLLSQLSPRIWSVISRRIDGIGEQNNPNLAVIGSNSFNVPTEAPPLPESWQYPLFKDTSDLLELGNAITPISSIFNQFAQEGEIIGALGQTDDLSPEIIEQMLAIEPTMVEYFKAEHLVAMSDEVFNALPDEYINSLDGFTRDALAAKALARSITNQEVPIEAVDLPSAWRIQPARILELNLSELIPTITFSVSAELPPSEEKITITNTEVSSSTIDVVTQVDAEKTIPKGPELPQIYRIAGSFIGVELDTADDLIPILLPENIAQNLGMDSLNAADFFNNLLILGEQTSGSGAGFDVSQLDVQLLFSALQECNVSILGLNPSDINFGEIIIGCTPVEVIEFINTYDSTFADSLQVGVYEYFSDDILMLPNMSPPLGDEWDTLASQPQFSKAPLKRAEDLITIGDGSASFVLNTINQTIPSNFSGYEVRLFNSLTPATMKYLSTREPEFYEALDKDILTKLSREVLAALPQEIVEALGSEERATIESIINGEQPTAAEALANLYQIDVIPPNPDAPILNPEWQFIGNFLNIDLNNAYDLFRFPNVTGTPSQFINGLFNTSGGRNFAPSLLGGMSVEAFSFISQQDPNFVNELSPQALRLLPDEIISSLPANIQERAKSDNVFVPTNAVTRVNNNPGLFVSVFKAADANTVETYYQIVDVIKEIERKNPSVHFNTVFEQSSFIEKSIEGVVREGGLGAIFAIIVILVFLSGGIWRQSARRIAGSIISVIFIGLLALFILSYSGQTNGDIGQAFAESDVVVRVLLILGGVIGILVTIWPGQLPYPAWRSTMVIAVSIPLSILMAIAGMKWFSPAMHNLISPLAESSGFFAFILRLFPENLTINIMTLSGLTVAIGRVVDDSIVVLENIFKQLQSGITKREAIISGSTDVSIAIFAATGIAVIVFLPLGLTGGIIGEVFLPFGLAVTYALAASFVVAITVVPALAYLVIKADDIHEDEESWMQKGYLPVLKQALASNRNMAIVIMLAFISLGIGGALFGTRPTTFLPAFGEPQITINVDMPVGTSILETNELTTQMETSIGEIIPEKEVKSVSTIVGGGGISFESLLGAGGGVAENRTSITIIVASPSALSIYTPILREKAESIFGPDNVIVSDASLADAGVGGFELVVSGPNQDILNELDPLIIETLEGIEGLTNVTSNLTAVSGGSDANSTSTYIRVNGKPALSYEAELETEDTLGVTDRAIQAVRNIESLPNEVEVSRGFNSEFQAQGFQDVIVAMGISLILIVIILVFTFSSLVYWLALIFSVAVAPVGAAIALTLADRPLGISALIGLLMLIGLVVTNAIVLIDRVQANRIERNMPLQEALIEAGSRRLRPILMTASATIFALIPLAIGLSEGAIIASELGIVVMGGLISSTLLTLIVVPAWYKVLSPIHSLITKQLKLNK